MSIHQKNTGSDREYPLASKFSRAEWQLRTNAAIQWLRRSIEVTGGKGSAHSWHPFFGWSKPYPETTGYIIPTLLDYAQLHQDESLKVLAIQCANWLTTIQLSSGAFSGLLLGNTAPSIFNTSQILFGLTRVAVEDTNNEPVKLALQRATEWLVSMLEQDHSWKKHAFVTGFTPAYYTRAVWGILQANSVLQIPAIQQRMQQALGFYTNRFLKDGDLQDWGFKPGASAFTHTIAYTLEGFLESALVLQETAVLSKTIVTADRLLAVKAKAGDRTAGRYAERWKGDYSFVCVTGNAQLSVFYHRLFEITGEAKYRDAGCRFMKEVIDCQKLTGNPNRVGALPGSVPFWGPYLPFRYPNWAAKFYLDAMKHC